MYEIHNKKRIEVQVAQGGRITRMILVHWEGNRHFFVFYKEQYRTKQKGRCPEGSKPAESSGTFWLLGNATII